MTAARWFVPAVALVVAAGCGGGASMTSSAPRVSTCPASRLSPSFRAETGSTGHYHAVLALVNKGPGRCRLFSTISVQMLDGNGEQLPTSTVVDTSTGRPGTVVLARSGRASIEVSWVEISSGEACVMPASLRATPPGSADALVVPWPADHDLVCGHGIITIRPARLFVPRV